MNVRFASGVVAGLCLLVASPLRAETAEQWIVKARAYLGSENALKAVMTIHFTGTLEIQSSAAESPISSTGQGERLPIEIIFQKPCQQQMTVIRLATKDTMALDEYDGWSRSTSRQDTKKTQLDLLDVSQIKQLRANTWENLNFFAGLEKIGGTVELGAEVEVDGVDCITLSFIHSDQLFFRRYFERASGRLVKTVTANGSEIREEGEIIADGIRFPKKILSKAATGPVTTIVFETVVLNENFPSSVFAVPSFLSE